MSEIITVGLDLAKNVFQVHGADGAGHPVLRQKLRRAQVLEFFSQLPSCVVAMEACGDAHYWGREIGKLGHEVLLIPPAYVKPFVKRQKNDAADAEAICEAALRPTMRFFSARYLRRFTMKNGRYSDAQIMTILKQAEGGVPVSELCRERGMSSASFYKWRAKFGGMDASLMSEMKDMAEENRRLKRMYAEMSMQNDLLRRLLEKSVKAVSKARDGHERGRTARRKHRVGLPCV